MSSGTYRRALAAVVAACAGMALLWALVVPAFQEPDELAHLDVALALYDAGRPFVVRDAMPASIATREARYLADLADYRRMRYDPLAREPVATMPLALALRDPNANDVRASHRKPSVRSRMPYVMFAYPIAYYGLLAAIMRLADVVDRGSLVDAFLVARLVNVALLVPTLLCASAVFRRAGLDRTNALLATIAVGAFPLTTWVAGYVQPDNLSLLLVTATLLAAMRWRARPASVARAAFVAAGVAALFVTKHQYAVAAWIATVALVSSRRAWRATALVVALPAVAFVASLSFTPVSRIVGTQSLVHAATARYAADPVRALGATVVATVLAAHDAFGGGNVFEGYWFRFGFRSGALLDGPARTFARGALVAATILVLAAGSIVTLSRARRIVRVARLRSRVAALRLTGSGVDAHLYLATTAVLVAASVATDGRLELEGRYWLPAIVPATLLVLVHAPRLVRRADRRRRVVRALAASMASAAVVASVVDARAMYADFYLPPRGVAHFVAIARVTTIGNDVTARNLDAPLHLDVDRPIYANGFAIDGRTGYAAKRVVLLVDGRARFVARTGLPSPDLAAGLHDDAVGASGFAVALPPHALSPGVHRFRFQVDDGPGVPAMRVGADLDVVGARA